MFKRIISLLICVVLSGVMMIIPAAVPTGAAAASNEKVYFVKEFDAPEDIGYMGTSNCCTPTISVSDDGLSVLRIENTVATNDNASGFFHPNGNGTKNAYLEIEGAPVLAFEYKVRMTNCNRYDYFSTRATSEQTVAIGGYYYVDKARAHAKGTVAIGNADQDQWNTITTVFSNTNGNRKIYINGEFAEEITQEHADYVASVYSTSNYKKFYPHFVAYMKNLGDYCEVDYMKVHTVASALNVEKVNVYDNRSELYVDFDSTVLNVKPEHFTLPGNEILSVEKYDMKENIVKLTLENPLVDYEKYVLAVNGVSNVGEAVCNQNVSFTASPVSASTPRFFQNGAEIKAYEYSEKPVSVSSVIKNYRSEATDATLYFSAYGEVNGEKTLIISKSASMSVPAGEEKELKIPDIQLSRGITEIKAFVWQNVTPVSLVASVSKAGYQTKADGIPDFGDSIELGSVAFAMKTGAASTGITKLGCRTYVAMVGTPGYVFEFDTYTGKLLGSYQSGSGLQHAIKVGSDGKVYTMISSSPDLYVFDPETRENKLIKADCCQGSSAWSMSYGANGDKSLLYMPVMSSDYKTLGTSVVEYDIDNGIVKAYDGFDIGCKYAHAATGDENYVYLASADGVEVATISRMDKKTGEIVTYENDTSVSPTSVSFVKVIGDYIFTRFYSHIIILNKNTMKRVMSFSGGGNNECVSDPDPSNPDMVYYHSDYGRKIMSLNLKNLNRALILQIPTSYGSVATWDYGHWFTDKDGKSGIAMIGGNESEPSLFHVIPSEKTYNHVLCDFGEDTMRVPTRPSYFYLTRDDVLYVGGYEAGLNGFDMKTNTPIFSVANGNQHGMTMVDGKLFGGSYGKSSIYMFDTQKPASSSNPKAVSSTKGVNRFYHTSDTNAGFGLSVGIADYGNPEGGVILMTYLDGSPMFKYYIGVIPGENIVGVAYKDGYIYASSSVNVPLYEDIQHEEAHVAKIDARTGETVLMKAVNFEGLPKTTKIGEIRFGPDGLLYGKANAGETVFALNPDDLSVAKYKSYYPGETVKASYLGEWLRFGDEGNLYAVVSGELHCINIETMESDILLSSCHTFTIDNDGNILKPKTYSSVILESMQVDKRQRLEIMIRNAQKYYKENEYSEDSWAVYEAALNEALEMNISEAYLPDVTNMARKLGFAIRDLQTVYDANAGFAFPFK